MILIFLVLKVQMADRAGIILLRAHLCPWSTTPELTRKQKVMAFPPEKKRSVSCGPIVKGGLGALHDVYSLFSSTSQKGMINEISNSKDFRGSWR